MSRPIVEVQNVKKSFGPKVVHRSVSFDLKENEILGLFGGSGSGKSVLIRSLIGLDRADEGRIFFDGEDITNYTEDEFIKIRTQIGYVFQNGALFDSLTVEQNLAYPLKAHTNFSEGKIKTRVNEMLEAIDMKGSNDLLPAELSGGMQKRAGLARAIILQPRVILFDEPTAGLDPINTARLLKNIISLKDRGMTGIFVTHDIPSAFKICDRIAILSEGMLAVNDTLENIKKSADPLVKSFIDPVSIDRG